MDKKTIDLWKEYNHITGELRKQLNSSANLTGDYAKHLICEYLNGKMLPASHKSADVEAIGKLYQVKARKISGNKTTTQLGIIRSWDFDYLAIVLFDKKGIVIKALLSPVDTASKHSVINKYQNGSVITTTQKFINDKNNIDITDALRRLTGDV